MAQFYHSIPHPPEGDLIRPSTCNIALRETGQGVIAEQVPYADENTPYVYASDNKLMSMTYAVPKGIREHNSSLPNGSEILIINQESIIGDPELTGGVYEFQAEGFVQMHFDGEPTCQWVNDKAIDLDTATFMPVRSLNDIMRAGVQIYQISDGKDIDARKLSDQLMAAADGATIDVIVQDHIRSGRLRWMNEERGINPVDPYASASVPQPVQQGQASPALLPS